MKRTIEHEGAVLEVELYTAQNGKRIFDVYRKEGPWLDDEDLINLADGYQPSGNFIQDAFSKMHKGGLVLDGTNDDHRIVEVYQ